MKKGDFIVLDIETTGLSPHRHEITELAAVKVREGEIIDEFNTLVNPKVPIPRFITKLTGITNEMVEYSPPLHKILPHFLAFLGDDLLVAHNAGFDTSFLNHNSQKHLRKSLSNERLCTVKVARRLLPSLESRKLGALCAYFGINNERAHRALEDTKATAEVFLRMLELLDKRGIVTREDVLAFQNLRIETARKMVSVVR